MQLIKYMFCSTEKLSVFRLGFNTKQCFLQENISPFLAFAKITNYNLFTTLTELPRLLALTSFFFPVALRPNAGHGLLILEVSRLHTMTRHSR